LSNNNLLIFYSKLDEINQFLGDLSNNKKYFEDPQIKGIDNFFRTIQRLQRIYFDNKKRDNLFDNIVVHQYLLKDFLSIF